MLKDSNGRAALQNLLTTSLLHDLKNQAHHLVLGLESLPVDPAARSQRDRLCHEAATMGNRLTEVLLILRLTEQRHGLQEDLLPVRPILKDVAEEGQQRTINSKLRVLVECDAGLLHYFDGMLVESALRSACDNALRHARSEVRLSARNEDSDLLLVVEDDGPGFPEELLGEEASIPAADPSQHRTGLGLQLAREVATAHHTEGRHGRLLLDVSPTLGGARLCLRLP